MRNTPALNRMSTESLFNVRLHMDMIYRHPETPEHVKEAAVAMLNFYGAEIDARMAAKTEGQ
ncbi:hypothetical protein RGQ21_67220 [Kitasatospora aureofaciens]|nr:hypothetical protein RGQ21_67220 [Kitasatospora aureofaciens]